MNEPAVKINKKGAAWHRTGHPWIYRDDLEKAEPALSGNIVSVLDNKGAFLGKAFYNDRSKISLRFIAKEDVRIDKAFWKKRISAAIEYRNRIIKDTDAYRLSHAEADGLPSLIVDRYGEHISIQTLSLGMDNIKDTIAEILIESLSPKSIVARNDSATRRLEGLPEEKEILYGEPPEKITVFEGAVRYLVDILNGQKTGGYLDQRENRIAAEGYARGKALDCFAYQGLFSLHAAKSSDEVTAIDSSAQALAVLLENAGLNSIKNIKIQEGNVFDLLKSYQKEARQFDLIVLDPPAFAKSKKDLQNAIRGYIDINLRAMKLLSKGGHLFTCSCSYNLSEGQFLEIVKEALKESGRSARLVEKRIQPADHPFLLNFPESNYLKCLVLEML
ncbi:MAG: class I SAM-dependent rRNA methyltransferase [Candidatus Omnitrophota bacterium]|nr:class I SAM-dependent rRNA methyltransferase [Candidatus Omnitrophota bacterium]